MRRTNEDFAAAVYHRGEAAIQANKRRRRVLLTTLPVAACLLAVSVAVLPERLPMDKSAGTAASTADVSLYDSGGDIKGAEADAADDTVTELYGNEKTASIITSTQSVEVSWIAGENSRSRLFTDKNTITALESLLPPEAMEDTVRGGESTVSVECADDATASKLAGAPYRFTLLAEDGTRYGYALAGRELYIERTAIWLPLTEDEAAALQEVLRQMVSDE